MSKKTGPGEEKRKRGRPRGTQEVVSEQAAAYGISLPVLTDTGERFSFAQ